MSNLETLLSLLTQERTIEDWLYEWRRPKATLTPLEIIALWCAEQLQPKTLKEWGSALGPKLKSELQQPHEADTPPLTMLEAALIAAISANDRAVEASRSLELLYHHVNITAMHQAARDPTYPREEAQVKQLGAYLRGETEVPAYVVEAARRLKTAEEQGS